MCAGCCESIRRFLFMEMFSYQRTPEAVSCQRSQDYPRTVGGEVEPVSASRIRAGGLQHLDASLISAGHTIAPATTRVGARNRWWIRYSIHSVVESPPYMHTCTILSI